jgi:hypothetical protein
MPIAGDTTMNKFITTAFVALTLLSAGARAQTAPAPDPKTVTAVKELLASMKYREMISAAMDSMAKNMPAMMLQTATNGINANTKLTDEEKKAALSKVAERIPLAMNGMQAILNDPTLIDDIIAEVVPLYARHFSAAEIHQMAVFYASPVGTKMLVVMPQIMAESMQIGQKVIMPRVAKQIEMATKLEAATK